MKLLRFLCRMFIAVVVVVLALTFRVYMYSLNGWIGLVTTIMLVAIGVAIGVVLFIRAGDDEHAPCPLKLPEQHQ